MNYRQDFPIFKNRPDLIYLDSAATSQKPQAVLDAVYGFYKSMNSNVHRGTYPLSEEATEAYEDARKTVSSFINAAHPHEVIFTRNATESVNLVARAYGDAFLNKGDEVLLTKMEHHSSIVPWLQLKDRKGIVLKYLDVSKEGRLIFDPKLITAKTKFVSVTAMSNVLGTIPDLKPIITAAHAVGAKVLVDACQSAVHIKTDVQALDADFLVFSGHKLYAPTGIGVLYAKTDILNQMPPFLGGGDMIHEVFLDHFTPGELPNKFEAGTPHIAGAIGLKAAIDYVNKIGFPVIQKIENELTEYLLGKFKALPYVRIIGPADMMGRGPVISFVIEGIHAHDMAEGFATKGICIRAGQHCAQPLMDYFEIPATARISLAIYNTKDEIDAAIRTLEEIYKYFNP
ncbi:SufS family cysteine desulfurase [Candidatus Peregrinibacteria bacterium]|nr:SufS family cysteine desulfurase [Candidatus Peregrinibacteria bacterium]